MCAQKQICSQLSLHNVVVTREIQLFQNYFSLRRRLSEIILFQCMETCLKLIQNYFRGLLQLTNIFQRVHCHRNDFEIISQLSVAEIIFISVSDLIMGAIKH